MSYFKYKITDECINCGACEPECPNAAISEGEIIFVIDPDKCNRCVGDFPSSQCASVCPVDACVPDERYPMSKDEALTRWQSTHPGQTPTAPED
ncbi:MAG: YfhL family 4Fe-4S dicluster ferredoxin [Dehalococcoidales bacterium]|nr:YfhL family 4Fe-4S dicluster ferredoxin [Dehalococcoidales bacterium]